MFQIYTNYYSHDKQAPHSTDDTKDENQTNQYESAQ